MGGFDSRVICGSNGKGRGGDRDIAWGDSDVVACGENVLVFRETNEENMLDKTSFSAISESRCSMPPDDSIDADVDGE